MNITKEDSLKLAEAMLLASCPAVSKEMLAERLYALFGEKQPPDVSQSFYGCDPKSVDLSKLRGPNGLPVEWVDFRLAVIGEMFLSQDGRTVDIAYYSSRYGPDKRRIIVCEVQPKAPRMWLATECTARPCDKIGPQETVNVFGATAHLHELPSLDDPKVLGDLAYAFTQYRGGTEQSLKVAIRAYLAMGAK